MTKRCVAFCRSINVGGNRATKELFIAAVSGLGYENVDTFLASGNILFHPGDPTAAPDAGAMATTLEVALEATLGFAVPTTIRTADELAALAAEEPFTEPQLAAAVGKPQVILLFDRSGDALIAATTKAAERSCDDDLLVAAAIGGAVHWLPNQGISGSGINSAELTKLFGLHTVRTINTISRLLKKV